MPDGKNIKTTKRPTPVRSSWMLGKATPSHTMRATPARAPEIEDKPPMTTMAKTVTLSDAGKLS